MISKILLTITKIRIHINNYDILAIQIYYNYQDYIF